MLSNVLAYQRRQTFIDMENDASNLISPANLMLENFLDNPHKEGAKKWIDWLQNFIKEEKAKEAATGRDDEGFEAIAQECQYF